MSTLFHSAKVVLQHNKHQCLYSQSTLQNKSVSSSLYSILQMDEMQRFPGISRCRQCENDENITAALHSKLAQAVFLKVLYSFLGGNTGSVYRQHLSFEERSLSQLQSSLCQKTGLGIKKEKKKRNILNSDNFF